ncbi:MAG: family 43 glycosylhydrolase [Lachnospiraceae bacterium]|nr:family 43 glycosylhydrolase [Lachnospiraceae bacterium]
MRNRIVAGLLTLSMILGGSVAAIPAVNVYGASSNTVSLVKSNDGNPVLGFDDKDEILYGGDPSALVDGDTVYLYVGHDASSGDSYVMPDWRCYSTKDLKNFTYEGTILSMTDIKWADSTSAWAGQVMKYKDKYYFYYCAESTASGEGKCIGVAVSDSPTGPFEDIGKPLVLDSQTEASPNWGDIDPTAWVETVDGVEHRYVAWGNTNYNIAELNEDMISIADRNDDGEITAVTASERADGEDGDILEVTIDGMTGTDGFTEAPWLYRRQDSDGNYTGQYYLFYAMNWRERMAYAVTDDLMSKSYTYGGLLMEPTATSNTNHMAVIDFKGKTYFIHHNGSLPWGSGFRRVICIQEMKFNDDGSIDYIEETSTGLNGTASSIKDGSGNPIAHENFTNSLSDSMYPYTDVPVSVDADAEENDSLWQIVSGKANPDNDAYVSIESYNKPGLYLQVDTDKGVTMGQDYQKASSDGFTTDSKRMTFKTLEGFDSSVTDGVTFESVKYPGYYLTVTDGELSVTSDPEDSACTFSVSTGIEESDEAEVSAITVRKTAKVYKTGSSLKTDDIRVTVKYDDGGIKILRKGFDVDSSSVDMTKAGNYNLKVTYKDGDGKEVSGTVVVKVVGK